MNVTRAHKQTIAVWFSCGAASAVAARMTFLRYGATHKIRVLNTPIIEEGEDNRRFLRDVAAWLGCDIEAVVNPNYPTSSAVDIWDRRKAMSFPSGAPCTLHGKKEARQIWEQDNPVDWHVFGFTVDEKARHNRFILTERDNVLPVLIDEGLTKQDCFGIITEAGIELPEAYFLGYPNANCRGCVKATSPTYWNHVRRVDPDVFASRAEQSRRLGAKLVRVNNQRIYLDELDPLAKGRPMQSLKLPDCGIICEEPAPRKV
jgi:hypothetical protein